MAIALAANAAYEEGLAALLESLKRREGFFFGFLGRLIRDLGLSDYEREILELLCLARSPLPREVVSGSVSFPASAAMRNLIALGAVDVNDSGLIEIAGVLREYFDLGSVTDETATRFHANASRALQAIARRLPQGLSAAVEAEYHAALAGLEVKVPTNLIDGSLATASELMRRQKYEEAAGIISRLLEKRETRDVLRLGAEAEARCGRFERASELARRLFEKDPKDSRPLADLARIALTQHQEDAAAGLIEIARKAGVEDVSILLVEGRMALRKHEYSEAERLFRKALQLTQRNPWPFFFLGRTLMILGRLDEAIDVFHDGEEMIYESESRNRKAYNALRTQLAVAYVYNNQFDLGAALLERHELSMVSMR